MDNDEGTKNNVVYKFKIKIKLATISNEFLFKLQFIF